MSVLAAFAAAPALAQKPELPRTYAVDRVDAPAAIAGPGDTFGFGVVNGGDLNRDGEDDLLVPQGARILNDGTGAEDGEIVVISGENGSVIRTIPAPEPDPGGGSLPNEDRRAGFGFYVGRIGTNATDPAQFTDLGSCPSGNTDADPLCDAATVGGPDGIPDIVASALFVDRASPSAADGEAEDIGRVYVIDGATFTVLKRIDMPQADVDDMADEREQLNPAAPDTRVRPWYGRTALNPAGQPPCAGNLGVGACATTSLATRRGDLDGSGRPDIVVGSSAYKYEEAEGTNPACDDYPAPAVDTCIRSGRAYMYRGEEIVGSDPDARLETAEWNIVNPFAQADDPNTRVINQLELLGHSAAPVGDVGGCGAPGAPGTFCPAASVSPTPDGQPEVLVSAFRVDYPTSGPDNDELFDVGVNLLLDGETGRILHTYKHPDPDPGSIFGFTIYNQPAVGDMGSTGVPDVFLPAAGQDTDEFRGEGMGFVMNGATVVSGNTIDLQRFRDPTPAASGSFGTTAAGVGDLIGDAKNEILIGEFATHNPPQNDQVISDVHFFDPVTGRPLQTVPDPDQQRVSNFGIGVAPLGDLNEDRFLDFAVGAGRFDQSPTQLDFGRVYIFRSDNSPAPAPSGPAPQPTTPRTLVAGRCANETRGTNNPETLNGTPAGDNMFGFGGNDVINGLQSDDCLFGGEGNDSLQGAEHNDVLQGEAGNDNLKGGALHDRLSGGSGRDRVLGDAGDDRLSGGSGNDSLDGGRGRNRYSAGSGNDRIGAANGRRETINCGSGRRDVVRADRTDRLRGCERVRRVR